MTTLPTLFLAGLAGLAVAASAPNDPPFVFRSVLDGRPRAVTAALHDDLWLSWDATTCSLVRAWCGDVRFDGAVYTSVHGPQPTSRGIPYVVLEEPTRFALETAAETVEGVPRYRGYALDEERRTVELRYALAFGERTLSVAERVRAVDDGAGVALVRRFRVAGLEEGEALLARGLDERGEPLAISAEPTELRRRFDVPDPDTLREAMADPAPREPVLHPDPPRGVTPGEIAVERIEDGHDEHGPRERGASLRVFDVDRELSELPRLVEGQTPNVNAVVPRVELFGPSAFGGLEETFLTVVSGFLATEAGTYGFRLSSDDGSELLLDGELLIDNDGLHGHEAVEAAAELEAGLHPFEIRHFENAGSQSLLLEWRRPGTYEYQVVPDEAYSCRAGEVRVTSPGAKEVATALDARAPGDGRPLEDVHPSYDLAQARPDAFRPAVGGLAFLPDGRLAVCTWDPSGSVYLLDGVGGDDPEAIGVRRIAHGLAEPLGIDVLDGRLFVLQKQELTELVDEDGDGATDYYRCVSGDWDVTANFHEFAFGLAHQGGRFYANLAIAIEPGGASSENQLPERGTTIRIDPATGEHEVVARGLRTPNGIGHGAGGALFLTDNQGDWLPVSKLLRLKKGAFYGSRSVLGEAAAELPVTPPAVWLPQGEIGNSPSQPAVIPPGHGPYSGQMILGDVTHGGVKRVFLEETDGVLQGAVFRFTQGLEAGVNRLCFGPDGALYVGGIGSTGNWGQAGKLRFGLQRLAYNRATAFEMLAVRAYANGFEVELTEPLAERWGYDPDLWEVTQWRYEPTADYGGEKLDERRLVVRTSTPSDDRRRVFVEVEGLAPGRVVHLRIAQPVPSETGRLLWTTEAWYTQNRVPRGEHDGFGGLEEEVVLNALTDEEREQGWERLFDGESLDAWRGFRREDLPEGWQVVGDSMARVGPGGDLVTRETYEDFELSLEWRISRGGNSGVFFRVSEDYGAVWQSGPEMQILDDDAHPDGRSPLTSAGANYALHAPSVAATRPVGLYNRALLRVWDDHVEHWLNGVKVLEYRLGDAEWEALVAESKFAAMPGYGRSKSGHIALQDHGDPVWFRNLKIRRL